MLIHRDVITGLYFSWYAFKFFLSAIGNWRFQQNKKKSVGTSFNNFIFNTIIKNKIIQRNISRFTFKVAKYYVFFFFSMLLFFF